MASEVKGEPAARSGGSQARTRLARRAVVNAARSLFLERGYQPTTIDAISERSDVPVATVYRLFSSKLGILKALLDVAIAGDDRALSVQERPQVAALFGETDSGKLLAGFASFSVAINERSSEVYRILASASGSDPAAAALFADYLHRGTRVRAGSRARWRVLARCGPDYANAMRPTSSTRSCPPSSTGCSSSTGAGGPNGTSSGSPGHSPTS